MTEEEIRFVSYIIGTSLQLRLAVSGYFMDKEDPFKHAAKLLLYAGIVPCKHGVWGGELLDKNDKKKQKRYCSKNH